MSVTIFCTKVGTKYPALYVNKLAGMFRRNVTVDYKFVCTTDDPHGLDPRIEIHSPGRHCWGWWNLMEAYSNPPWCEGGPIFYVGLDTIITGNIDKALGMTSLTMIRDFSYLVPELFNAGNPFIDSYADGVCFIPAGGLPDLWELFHQQIPPLSNYPMHVWLTSVMKQRYIQPRFYQDIYPDLLCSFKWPEPKFEQPKEPIVCFHGSPRPVEVCEIDWIKEHWRE